MPTIFSKIAAREIPGYFVAEDKDFFAILDINPLTEGHTLVIPKIEVDYLFDLDDETTAAYHVFAKKVSKAIEANVSCERIGMAVIGLEVPHAHIHLIPINGVGDINFARPKLEMNTEQFETLSENIRNTFTSLD